MLTDISPDGVRVVIDWSKFVPGTSVFIPAINTNKAVEHLLKAVRIDKEHITKRVCIENGKYGVRVWRMK
tara:strand:+ start:750 stop:959 length:210 start_codon:yes stop_codon:yes gene_type:complete